jgi:hypothetical protein
MEISKNDINVKHPVPTDWYYATITQGYLHPRLEDPVLVLCHTIDTGDYAYQHVLSFFNLELNNGQARLKKMSDGIEFNWFVKDVYDPLFPEQFVALRSHINVVQSHNSKKKTIRNTILEWKVADMEPKYNVMKPRDTSVFKSSENKGRPTLPI